MTVRAVGSVFLRVAVLMLAACGGEWGGAAPQPGTEHASQEVNSTNKVLILGSSVNGGLNSREALAVRAAVPDTQIDVVTPQQWRAMKATQFMAYRALIVGDAACQSGEAAFQVVEQTRNLWGAIVDGRVAVLATDPTTNETPRLVENAIQFVTHSAQYRTGMYIALGCAYANAQAPKAVTLLEPFGTFKVQGVQGCASSGHMFEMLSNELSASISDTTLAGNGCVARSVFTQYPQQNFSLAALAVSSPSRPVPAEQLHVDYLVHPNQETSFVGAPYFLVRGALSWAQGCGNDHGSSHEECDMGNQPDGLNGRPASETQDPLATCSWSCHQHWCGDGHVDTEYGEECDLGLKNGRTPDKDGTIGACTASCQIPRLSDYPTSHPPTALCANRLVVADYTCSEPASIDNGSYDVDGDMVGCTQSPASAYNIGKTTVTLTCTDRAGLQSSCTAEVTVVDHVAPTLTLQGTVESELECTAGATYDDPGATANDLCEGSLPVQKTGTVDVGTPGTYSVRYDATDASGNRATPVSRTVDVIDTLAPGLQVLPGPSIIACNGTPYVDPGARASDRCDGDLSTKITSTSNLDQSHTGQYTVSYRVADRSGHVSTAARTLTVEGPCASTCVTLHLGDYNLFLLGDYNGGHDVLGKVAAGGNISLTDFAVGVGLPDNNISNTLVAGGNLTLSRGGVWGDARYGGTYSADPSVVYPRGTVARGTPIDFTARFAELRALSSQLAGLAVNGTTNRTSWGGVMLRGTSGSVNVFNVDASAFNGMKLLSIDAPGGSLVVVNIRGTSASFSGGSISFSGGIDPHGVLYNFVDATSITAQGFSFWGTVLAPYANVSFSNGSWDGGLYAVSLTGNAEGHINPLTDRDVCGEPPDDDGR